MAWNWVAQNWMWIVGVWLLWDIANTLRGILAKLHQPDEERAALRLKHGVSSDE